MHRLAVLRGGKDAPPRTRVASLRVILPATAVVVGLLASSLVSPSTASADEPQTGLLGSVIETTATVTNATTGRLTAEPAPAPSSASAEEPAGIPGLSLPPPLEPVANVATPLLAPAEPLLDDVAPAVETLQPAVDATRLPLEASARLLTPVAPVLDALQPVVETAAPLVGSVVEPAAAAVAGLTQPVVEVTTPLLSAALEPVVTLTTPVVGLAADTVVGVIEPVVDIVAPVIEVVPPIIDDVLPGPTYPSVETPPLPSPSPVAPLPQQPSQALPPPSPSAVTQPAPAIRTEHLLQYEAATSPTATAVVVTVPPTSSGPVIKPPAPIAVNWPMLPTDFTGRLALPLEGAAAETGIASQAGGPNYGLPSLHVPGISATARFDRAGSFAALLPALGMLVIYLWLRGGAYLPIAARPPLRLIFTPPR